MTLTIAECPDQRLETLAAWVGGGQRCTIATHSLPWWLGQQDVGRRLLAGEEPLMKVRQGRGQAHSAALAAGPGGDASSTSAALLPTATQVKLCKLADGDVLGIAYSHALFDGTRWPAFARHLAARYQQACGGGGAAGSALEGALLKPCDRGLLTWACMATVLLK